jgi:hypothetical protein
MAQIVAGRWLKRMPGMGGGGMVDEPAKATEDLQNIRALQERVDELAEPERLKRQAEELDRRVQETDADTRILKRRVAETLRRLERRVANA